MNRSRLFMIGGLALALGLLISYPIYNRLRSSGGANNEPGVDVVVAANDLQVGTKLEDRDIRMTRFPQSVVPPGAFTKKNQVLGRGVVLPVSRGEFILPAKLAAANAGSGLPSLIPPGMRAVSVRVNDVVSVAGFVQPGSRVDVLATGNQGGNERQITTVLENVAVIAVGKNLERNPNGDSQPAPVITLLVSPEDGQRLTLASQEGRIQLALRNPLDTRREQIGATRASSLYPGGVQPVSVQTKPRTHKTIPVTVIPPSAYSVETIRGNKRDETKF
ncbi:MAG: Flp pilus assembly protein CpaB [Acidobacteria bacterium]|nr:MAG: Flp pilus assembly protein CpaB [Acidobacteriota bacterium]HYK49536.1 Flp pilus assembly protein CpaB [Terriglobales bacterium]